MLVGHSRAVVSCKFKPRDGSRIVSAGADSTAKIWNVDSGECTATLSGHSQGICDVAWSSRGTYLCTASDDQTLKIWVSTPLLHMQLAVCMHPVAACLNMPPIPAYVVAGCGDWEGAAHVAWPHQLRLLLQLPPTRSPAGEPFDGSAGDMQAAFCDRVSAAARMQGRPMTKVACCMPAYRHPGHLTKP